MEIYFRKHNVWSQTFAQYSHVTRWINRREIWFVYSIISWWKRWDKLEWWECVIFDAVLFADASLSATTQFNSSSAIKPLSYRWWRMRQENRGMQKEACTHIMKVSERKRMIEITLNFIWLHFGDVLRSTSKKKRALPFSITSTNKSHTHTHTAQRWTFFYVCFSSLFSSPSRYVWHIVLSNTGWFVIYSRMKGCPGVFTCYLFVSFGFGFRSIFALGAHDGLTNFDV